MRKIWKRIKGEKERRKKIEKESLTKTYNIRGNTMENLFLPVTGIGTGLKDAQPVVSAMGDRLSPQGRALTGLQAK